LKEIAKEVQATGWAEIPKIKWWYFPKEIQTLKRVIMLWLSNGQYPGNIIRKTG
jgi:hypothetical protein